MRETRVGAPVGHQPSANPHVVIPVQLEPAVLPSYTIPPSVDENQFLACRRARFRRRNFFLRHFHRWLPVFFHAREPRFMVNVSATCRQYMSASDHVATLEGRRMAQDPPSRASRRERGRPQHEEGLSAWYSQAGVLDLAWLDHPSRHHVRWRQTGGRWVMAKRRFSGGEALARHLSNSPPADLYVSTSAWLDPVNLPGLRDETRPPPVLLDHLVVFDLDLGPFSMKRLETVRKRTSDLITWLDEHTNLVLLHVTFSGGKGFHVVLGTLTERRFEVAEPREREAVREHRQALLERVMAAGHAVDPTVTADTRRIIRVPGSLHGRTRWACTVLEEGLIHQPLRRWVAPPEGH